MEKSEIDAIVRRSEQAAHALMNGDPSQFEAFATLSEDFTIFGPVGGPAPLKGATEFRKAAAGATKLFKKGEAKVELFAHYASGDLLVLVPVSYTHLDVYKRQRSSCSPIMLRATCWCWCCSNTRR